MKNLLPYLSDPHCLALCVSVCSTSCAQILMKAGARNKKHFAQSFMNPLTIAGYSLFVLSALLVAFAMQTIDLKTASMWGAIPYMLVMLLARFFLKEPVGLRKLGGCALIMAGLAIFHMNWNLQ